MSDPKKKNKRPVKVLLGLILVLIAVVTGRAILNREPPGITEAERNRPNPVPASEANIAAARELYAENCANCHGKSGKGDGSEAMMYDPAPSNLTDAPHMQKLTDGEIFFQITQGKKPMPSYKNKLTETERWQLVLLMREISSGVTVQPGRSAGH